MYLPTIYRHRDTRLPRAQLMPKIIDVPELIRDAPSAEAPRHADSARFADDYECSSPATGC